MKITLFGATGKVGRRILDEAEEPRHQRVRFTAAY
jgi:putative NADH-flavin reductase